MGSEESVEHPRRHGQEPDKAASPAGRASTSRSPQSSKAGVVNPTCAQWRRSVLPRRNGAPLALFCGSHRQPLVFFGNAKHRLFAARSCMHSAVACDYSARSRQCSASRMGEVDTAAAPRQPFRRDSGYWAISIGGHPVGATPPLKYHGMVEPGAAP